MKQTGFRLQFISEVQFFPHSIRMKEGQGKMHCKDDDDNETIEENELEDCKYNYTLLTYTY